MCSPWTQALFSALEARTARAPRSSGAHGGCRAHLIDTEDLAGRLLELVELVEEIPEARLGGHVVGREDPHAVDLRLRVLLRRNLAPHDLVVADGHRGSVSHGVGAPISCPCGGLFGTVCLHFWRACSALPRAETGAKQLPRGLVACGRTMGASETRRRSLRGRVPTGLGKEGSPRAAPPCWRRIGARCLPVARQAACAAPLN